MTARPLTTRQQGIHDTIVYWLLIAAYALLFYLIGAPGWALVGFSLTLAKVSMRRAA